MCQHLKKKNDWFAQSSILTSIFNWNVLFYKSLEATGSRNALVASGVGMFCFPLLWASQVPECFVLKYFGRFRVLNDLFYDIVGASGAGMRCFVKEIGTATTGVTRSWTATPGNNKNAYHMCMYYITVIYILSFYL